MESKSWVQFKRVDYLSRYQDKYSFKVFTIRQFYWLWVFGFLRNKPIYFSSWRMVHGLLKKKPNLFTEEHYLNFGAAVTSHSNIGGGLKPEIATPNRGTEEAFELAVSLLKKFKVVTVNSLLLDDLIRPKIHDVMYCPNGVDQEIFKRKRNKKITFDSNHITIGWVGKQRISKNYEIVKKALDIAHDKFGITSDIIKLDKNLRGRILNIDEMVDYYNNIDFYLCASWNEGTPNPCLEAASCSIPVITTYVGNMPELITNGVNGFFIEPRVDSILDVLHQIVIMKSSDYMRMSHNIRKEIDNNWTWKSKINGFVDVFDKLTVKK